MEIDKSPWIHGKSSNQSRQDQKRGKQAITANAIWLKALGQSQTNVCIKCLYPLKSFFYSHMKIAFAKNDWDYFDHPYYEGKRLQWEWLFRLMKTQPEMEK